MTRRIRILHVEDDPLDAELVAAALQEHGVIGDVVRVADESSVREALERGGFDVILSDFTMPTQDGTGVLSIARNLAPEVPFIFVSGTIGEERAVNALRAGATDYILKDRLSRLGPAVARALRESQLVAERRRAEEELRGMHARLQRLLAVSPAVIYSAEAQGMPRITYVSENVRTRFGYDPREIVEDPRFWMEAVHPDDRARALSSDSAYDMYRLRHKDGTWRWVEDHRTLVKDTQGSQRVGSWLDVTRRREDEEERARLEARVEQAQRLESIGSLAGGIAHDFNNILMVVLGSCDVLLQKLPPDDASRYEVEEIKKAGGRAAALTRQLLTFSRKQETVPREMDPCAAVRNLAKMLERLIGEHNRIELELDPRAGRICCDFSQFDQIMVNLVVNARDAMPSGGVIRISVKHVGQPDAAPLSGPEPGDQVCITVSDSGVGIPRENLGRIFDPFFTTKPKGKGTGLGLSTVYGAVTQNKGRIDVESTPGVGTAFRILFPAISSPASPEAASGREDHAAARGETILLVEDDSAVRRVAAIMLRQAGYAVIEASCGGDALVRFKEHGEAITMMLTDMIMPGMGGAALAEQVRGIRPGLKILFCTGYTEDFVRPSGGAEPAHRMINKPFTRTELLEAVRAVLDS